MADKNYKLSFVMSDGSTKDVQFTAPQGPKGDPGEKGEAGSNGVGITNITIAEV